MPWKRADPMEERMRLVMEVESEVFQMSELCERYGVSRKTGYKWFGAVSQGRGGRTAGSEPSPPTLPASHTGSHRRSAHPGPA